MDLIDKWSTKGISAHIEICDDITHIIYKLGRLIDHLYVSLNVYPVISLSADDTMSALP